jgi:MoaA/NifB/PqqE/SkfB family radical SAM enzyme
MWAIRRGRRGQYVQCYFCGHFPRMIKCLSPALTFLASGFGSQFSTKLLPAHVRPLSAHVKLTENCQARCISCDYWKTRWKDGIDTNRSIALINEIGELGIQTLRFTGGEPLVRKDFFEVLRKSNTSGFKRIIIQTNGLLLKRFADQVNESPITNINVSIDGMREANDRIRGIQGYFDLALEGIRALRKKRVAFSVTLNGISAGELGELAEVAHGVGADIEFNILSRSLFFLKNGDIAAMWPDRSNVAAIERFLHDVIKRPEYEVDYIRRYYNHDALEEPPCVLGFLQVFVLSNGDVLTGCYPLPPVGNILKNSLREVMESELYRRQAEAMVRRECPGCTCGIESSLAMKNAFSSAFFHISNLMPQARQPA